jgi:hypothetical protein
MRAPDAVTTWEEFQQLFKRHHIPDGLMERKREEFRNLTQGAKDVQTYSTEFTLLARYAGDEVSIDEKKQDRFRRGLNPAVKFSLNLIKCKNFEELVDTALRAEYGRQEFEHSRKHSRDSGSSSAPAMPPQKRRVWEPNTTPARPSYTARPAGFGYRPPAPALAPRGVQF